MRITVKSQQKSVAVKVEPITQSQKELFEIDPEKTIPYGKYKDRTVADIAKIDPGYIKWIEREGLVEKWQLYHLKQGSMKVQVSKVKVYVNESGEQWVGLREIPNEITTKSP